MRLSVNGVTLIDEWTLLFSRNHSWVKPTKTAKITKPIHRTRKFHRKNRSSITFFGITVVSIRFRNLPTEGSTSSGLMMISSSLKVILKLDLKRGVQNLKKYLNNFTIHILLKCLFTGCNRKWKSIGVVIKRQQTSSTLYHGQNRGCGKSGIK